MFDGFYHPFLLIPPILVAKQTFAQHRYPAPARYAPGGELFDYIVEHGRAEEPTEIQH